ncbi:hypothetical protein BKA58DRAFT_410499 [Alternaria rosae]|uniref:uncharacterized protein n=1 Tax=Alternaria rosae TaxID=1187941 RepID=UPI001E8D50C0|nr:uncharacterized protein BKA58DRAFT_410499 [Alternaria rosae]KAH6872383.1 hypothetical protein BKA58DRAFT_410499 [Alternaria rosae]
MAAILEFCSLPFEISDAPITNERTRIYVRCHDRLFSNVTLSWRRQVKDTSGVPVFDPRHHGSAMKNFWTVESPDGQRTAELKHVSSGRRSDLGRVVPTGKDKEDDVVLQVRQKDQSAITTRVFSKDICIAELLLQESNDISNLSQVDRSSWKVRIAGVVDPAVILIIALCRAEMRHVWRQ